MSPYAVDHQRLRICGQVSGQLRPKSPGKARSDVMRHLPLIHHSYSPGRATSSSTRRIHSISSNYLSKAPKHDQFVPRVPVPISTTTLSITEAIITNPKLKQVTNAHPIQNLKAFSPFVTNTTDDRQTS